MWLNLLALVFILSCSTTVEEEESFDKASDLSYPVSIISLVKGNSESSGVPSVNNGGDSNLSFSISSSTVAGITINSSTGEVTVGAETAVGNYSINVAVSNKAGSSVFPAILTVTVLSSPEAPSALVYSPNSFNAVAGETTISATPSINDGGATITGYTIQSAPSGITINSSGVITVGSSTAVGTYVLSVDVTNSVGTTSFANVITITVFSPTAPVSISYSNASLDVPNSQSASSVTPTIDDGGSAITKIEFINPVSGITISSNGVITATDDAAEGSHILSIRLTNGIGSTDFTNHFTVKRRKVNYTSDLLGLFSSKCTPCHTTGSQPHWNVYNTAKSNIDNIISRISNNSMPQGGPALPQNQKDLISQWKTDGLLENE